MTNPTRRTICATAVLIASTTPAFAYLDPGTASILLQAILGSIAAGMAVITMNYQRFKFWLLAKFSRDRKQSEQSTESHDDNS